MQVTRRFFLMNLLAMLASVVVTALAVVVFIAVYTRVSETEANLHHLTRWYELRAGLGDIKQEAERLSFDQLLDPQTQKRLSDRVEVLRAHAMILKNREVVFSTAKLDDSTTAKLVILTDQAEETDSLELDGNPYIFNRVDYRLASGERGTLLLFAQIHPSSRFFLHLGIFAVIFFLCTFLAANMWVSLSLGKRILTPLSRLKEAAVQISEGDLSGGIAEEGEGEIRELSRTLELLRMKLKESILLQQKFDENRKFLISSISHDLKTPVTSIKGYVEGIIDGVAQTPEKKREYLETVRSKAMLVNSMIDDLLFYSKLDMKQIPFHFERTDLEAYMDHCVSEQRYEFEKAKVPLSLRSELKEQTYVYIDRERFARVIQNVLDNAKKYIEKPAGEVSVILRETRTSAIIEIRDNGRGIPEEHLAHIFERFYRGDSSRSGAEGSGLGLAISKQIVEGHEGKIWVTSKLGEGTRVMISLKKH